MSFSRKQKGFTLIEMVLSVAMLAILVGIAVPVYLSFRQREDAALASIATAQSWRRAAQLSRSGLEDDSWGVYVQSGSVTLFHGTSYSARDTIFDELTPISTAITISGSPSEVVFSAFSGEPSVVGTLTFTGASGTALTATINAQGMVEN